MKNSGNFRLGDWLVEPDLDRISQGDRRVGLQPQVMDLLVFLANRYNEVISIDELLSRIWKDRVVTNASIYSSLKQLRAALGDDVQNPSYIQTIPKRGYRLNAKPEFLCTDNGARSALKSSRDKFWIPEKGRNWQGPVLLAVAVMMAIFAAFFYSTKDSRTPPKTAFTTPELSIAVLPFVDMSAEHDQQWYSDGIAKEILDKLGPFPGLKVAGQNSSFRYRQPQDDLKSIGKSLGVAHLLKGSVRRDGERVKVTAQLTHAEDGFPLWSREYDRNISDTMAIQDDIASNIANVLALQTPGDKQTGTVPAPSPVYPQFSAYELYLQALTLINQKTKRSLMTALTKLKMALKQEPEFAEAHVAIARTYEELTRFTGYYQQDWRAESRSLAMPHLERALEINPNFAGAYVVLGDLLIQRDQCLEAYQKALSLNPNLYRAHMSMGVLVMDHLLPWSNSLVHLERALEIEPFSEEAAIMLVMFLQFVPHRWEEAERILTNLAKQFPDSTRVKRAQAEWVLLANGRPSEAVHMFEKLIVLDPDDYWARSWLSKTWYMLGETERAMQSSITTPHWRYVLSPHRETSLVQLKEAPEWNKEIDFGRRLLFAYVFVMLRDWQSAVDLLAAQAQDLESFSRSSYVQNLALNESPAMSLAVAYKNLGDLENFEKFAEFEKMAVNIRTENGKLHNEQYSRAMARLNALEGKHYEALLELEHLILTGKIDPRELLHPAFDEMRNDPQFERLEQLQLERINSQRAKLDLAPIAHRPGKIRDS